MIKSLFGGSMNRMNPNETEDFSLKTNPKGPWSSISTVIVWVLVVVVAVVTYWYLNKDSSIGNNVNNSNKKTVAMATCKLDGTSVEKDLASKYPLAIIIENHPEARPQSGLSKASIVYEAISEGGITRFMAIFGPRVADKVGPVRSVRTYFVDWTSEYNAYLAHVGGNLDALDMIKANNMLDLDQFGLGEPTYWRELDPNKSLEHTMYTKTDFLYAAAKTKKYSETANFQALSFRKAKLTPDSQINQSINIDFSTASYNVSWDFNPQTNTYLRTMANTPHRDATTGDRLAASNLIIQEVDRWETITTINEQGYAMKTIGTGKAKIFIEGKEIDGTWKKTGRTERTIFYDETGSEIEFIPGQFWYEITPPEVFKTIKIS